jgi:hypothetical protein
MTKATENIPNPTTITTNGVRPALGSSCIEVIAS